jgi:hypothetical protein
VRIVAGWMTVLLIAKLFSNKYGKDKFSLKFCKLDENFACLDSDNWQFTVLNKFARKHEE